MRYVQYNMGKIYILHYFIWHYHGSSLRLSLLIECLLKLRSIEIRFRFLAAAALGLGYKKNLLLFRFYNHDLQIRIPVVE